MLTPPTRRLTVQLATSSHGSRLFSTKLPLVADRRPTEFGSGGRASDAGFKVAIFGATGFLGRYVCSELGANGVLAYIANRGDEFEVRHLKTQFDLGRSRFVFYSPRDRESMKNVIADADIVINLIGKYYESKAPYQTKTFPYVGYKTNFSFEDANVSIPRTIAELCLEMQVDNFIHVSSAAADPDSPSEWARTKFAGEEAIKEVYPWVTIVRPTQMFGHEDKFLNFVGLFAARYPFIPLVDGGDALTQPVYVADVARAINRICDSPHLFEGRRVDCFGPSDYSYKELAEFVTDITLQGTPKLHIPKDIALMMANVIQYQRNPPLTPDMVHLMSRDYLPAMTKEEYASQKSKDAIFTLEDLHLKQTPIEKEAFNYMHRYRQGGHFDKVEGYH